MMAVSRCGQVLADGGYIVSAMELDDIGSVLLAETIYALVMVVEVPDEHVERFVDDAQARLTRLAAAHPSARIWDLYLVLFVGGDGHRYDTVRERFEADTRYTRKLVVFGDDQRLTQLLRPLLPFSPLPELALSDPLAEVQRLLVEEGIEERLADQALRSFGATDEVEIP